MAGGLYSPSAGDVLTAANAIDYWSKQVVIICTSGTRPASPRAGMTIYQTDTNVFAVYGTAWCETTPFAALVATSETTTSTSYTDLSTSGPAVTVTTGTKALVTVGAFWNNSTNTAVNYMSYAVSGATTSAGADTKAAVHQCLGGAGTTVEDFSKRLYNSGLTAGANVFTAKYRVNAGTGTFANRNILVETIPT